jgi:hypothetical protein
VGQEAGVQGAQVNVLALRVLQDFLKFITCCRIEGGREKLLQWDKQLWFRGQQQQLVVQIVQVDVLL